MFGKFRKTVAVNKKAVKFHHPVLHITLMNFGHDAVCNILTAVCRTSGNTAAAFLKYMFNRCVSMDRVCVMLTDPGEKL